MICTCSFVSPFLGQSYVQQTIPLINKLAVCVCVPAIPLAFFTQYQVGTQMVMASSEEKKR